MIFLVCTNHPFFFFLLLKIYCHIEILYLKLVQNFCKTLNLQLNLFFLTKQIIKFSLRLRTIINIICPLWEKRIRTLYIIYIILQNFLILLWNLLTIDISIIFILWLFFWNYSEYANAFFIFFCFLFFKYFFSYLRFAKRRY